MISLPPADELSPKEVLGDGWYLIVTIVGECWEPNEAASHDELTRAATYYAELGHGASTAVRVCENLRCVNPEHLVRAYSHAGRLLFVKNNSQAAEDGCRIWTGELSAEGRPVMRVKRPGQRFHATVRVIRFVYEQEHGTHSVGSNVGTIQQTCGKLTCVSYKHLYQALRPASGKCDKGHTLPPDVVTHCPECHAYKPTNTTCQLGHTFGPGHARLYHDIGCWYCRREDATEYIRSRNAEFLKRHEDAYNGA
jgi:hypothetical protein